jgi:hypothetical protein
MTAGHSAGTKYLEGSVATAAGSVRCEAEVEGRSSRDPYALHPCETRPV